MMLLAAGRLLRISSEKLWSMLIVAGRLIRILVVETVDTRSCKSHVESLVGETPDEHSCRSHDEDCMSPAVDGGWSLAGGHWKQICRSPDGVNIEASVDILVVAVGGVETVETLINSHSCGSSVVIPRLRRHACSVFASLFLDTF